MSKMRVILNPIARGCGVEIESQLRRFLEEEGLDFEIVSTTGPGHATELAKQAVSDGFDVIVAAGGNGTCNEVINGLIAASGNGVAGTFGIAPIGLGNEFANTVGIPLQLREACHRLAYGQVRLLDVGRVFLPDGNSRFFVNTVGIGFDGRIAFDLERRNVRNIPPWLWGLPMYLWMTLKAVALYNMAPVMKIEFDGQMVIQPSLMVVIANAQREGTVFLVAPQAELDDGFFDLLLIRGISRLQILRLIPSVVKGTQAGKESITLVRTRHVRVTSGAELVAHIDGEILCVDAHRLEFEILPQRLRVLC